MKRKTNKNIIIIGIVLFLIIVMFFSFGMQSVAGWTRDLSDYSNRFSLNDTNVGTTAVTLAYLDVPKKTNNFSFTVEYDFTVQKSKSSDGQASILYEVFNHQTNQFETIYTKQWTIPYSSEGTTYFRMKGTEVYNTGIPKRITNNQISKGIYERTYGCLDGMTIEQAKILNPPSEGTSTYLYKCAYPGEDIRLHDYGDDDWGDIYYFPKLINLDSKYILNDNVTFRISASRSGGLDTLAYYDFDIEFWKINTDLVTYYRFENEECNEIQLMTYQTTPSDYLTEKECRKANGLGIDIDLKLIITIISAIVILVFIILILFRRKK